MNKAQIITSVSKYAYRNEGDIRIIRFISLSVGLCIGFIVGLFLAYLMK